MLCSSNFQKQTQKNKLRVFVFCGIMIFGMKIQCNSKDIVWNIYV